MKILLNTALLLTLSLPVLAWNPQNQICTRESSNVNVRKGPGINHEIAYQIPVGTVIQVLEWKNGWGRIFFRGNYQNSSHWVKGDFLCGHDAF